MTFRLFVFALLGFAIALTGGCRFDRYVSSTALLDPDQAVAPLVSEHGHLMVFTNTDRRFEDGFEEFANVYRAQGASDEEICFGSGLIGLVSVTLVEPPSNLSDEDQDAWIETAEGIAATIEVWRAEMARDGRPSLLTDCTVGIYALIVPIEPETGSPAQRYSLETAELGPEAADYLTLHTLQDETRFIFQAVRNDGSAAYEFFARSSDTDWTLVEPEAIDRTRGVTRIESHDQLLSLANSTFDDPTSPRSSVRFEPLSQDNRAYLEDLRARLEAAEAQP